MTDDQHLEQVAMFSEQVKEYVNGHVPDELRKRAIGFTLYAHENIDPNFHNGEAIRQEFIEAAVRLYCSDLFQKVEQLKCSLLKEVPLRWDANFPHVEQCFVI